VLFGDVFSTGPYRDVTSQSSHYLVLGGHKYGDLALQVGVVSYETVKYDREF
jgi:hypothetical protein